MHTYACHKLCLTWPLWFDTADTPLCMCFTQLYLENKTIYILHNAMGLKQSETLFPSFLRSVVRFLSAHDDMIWQCCWTIPFHIPYTFKYVQVLLYTFCVMDDEKHYKLYEYKLFRMRCLLFVWFHWAQQIYRAKNPCSPSWHF